MNRRDLSLDQYGISKHRYRELMNFVLQYNEFKAEKAACYSLDNRPMDGTPHGSGTSDPTAQKAERAYKLSKNIELIEQTAIEAAGAYHMYILRAVTEGLLWADFENPYCKADFYDTRRRFFYILSLKKG